MRIVKAREAEREASKKQEEKRRRKTTSSSTWWRATWPRSTCPRSPACDGEAGRIVLDILSEDLFARLDAHLADALRSLLDGYRAVASKYEVSLEQLEAERDEAAARLTELLTRTRLPPAC